MRRMRLLWIVVLSALVSLANVAPRAAANQRAEETTYDLVVYGGTSAGVIAAVQARKMGKTAIIVCPDKNLGGLTSGGLGYTDTGNKAVIGGLARDFYHRIWKHYQQPEAWRWQKREEYGNRGQGTPAIDGEQRTMWIFEPHAAEKVYEDLVAEYEVPVHRDRWLDRKQGVTKSNGRIQAITMLSGETYRGKMFIDATYEGDLMATAGIDYTYGRESNDTYDEMWNGVQTGVLHHRHHFGVLKQKIDPYVVPGDPSSGLLPRISAEPPGEYGSADRRIQAYCFRMCLTNKPENRVPFPRPKGYDPKQYELLLRIFDAGWREMFAKFDPIPNQKTDTNNHGPFSTDNIGYNYDYPEASYERRREIIDEHRTYQQGLMYFMANDPRVPEDVRSKMSQWGLARDEFTDNDHWPHQIYVREARRMIGKYVMTEHELLKRRPTPEPIGMGSYTIDSHNVQRYVTPEGYVQNEGDIGVPTGGPYSIALGSILPKEQQCENLLVPVCVSSSHIAFGSIRMEPVFMILGQSAATVAVLAIDREEPVQKVPYDVLRERLLKDGQILQYDGPIGGGTRISPQKLDGVVVDDSQARRQGHWLQSAAVGKYVGNGYVHNNKAKDLTSLRFETRLPEAGQYEVRLAYPAHNNRAAKVAVVVEHAGGATTVVIDQRKEPEGDGLFASLGTFAFTKDRPAAVTISNEGATGYVVADAVQWLPKKAIQAAQPDKDR